MHQLIKGLLTIGIPSYNGGDNLADLFLSIKNLGLSEDAYEIIVVDNGSTDDTDDIINKLKTQLPNLSYFKNSHNIGRIENWNKVIELAHGDYLIIMNVNDRFLKFDMIKYIRLMDHHPEIPLILTDIKFIDHIYPNWIEEGGIDLEAYLKKTFLDPDYLEFHAVGLLHQHVFRTNVIIDNHIQFDPGIPRTTDRVFTAEVIKAGGGIFYYAATPMVSWHLNKGRYHYNVHVNPDDFNFSELWINEYKANIQLAELGNIPYRDVLKSQLILASFFMQVKLLRSLKNKIAKTKTPTKGMEVPTAAIFYAYLKIMAGFNRVHINYYAVKAIALKRALIWYLRSINLYKKKGRSLKGIVKPIELI